MLIMSLLPVFFYFLFFIDLFLAQFCKVCTRPSVRVLLFGSYSSTSTTQGNTGTIKGLTWTYTFHIFNVSKVLLHATGDLLIQGRYYSYLSSPSSVSYRNGPSSKGLLIVRKCMHFRFFMIHQVLICIQFDALTMKDHWNNNNIVTSF